MKYNTKYKIGDKVKVRKWDDMAQEFGLDYNENIPIDGDSFVKPMREYCEQLLTINTVSSYGYCAINRYGKRTGWLWTDSMFEENPPIKKLNLEPIVAEFEITDLNVQRLNDLQKRIFLIPQSSFKATITMPPKVGLLELAEKVNEIIDKINKI